MIVLPRRARDKHRESTRKGGVFRRRQQPIDAHRQGYRDAPGSVSEKRFLFVHFFLQDYTNHHFTKTRLGQT